MNDINLPQESRIVEYKQQATDLRKIAQTVVAFANGIGGELMIGVEDKTRTIVGLDSKTIDDLLERLPLSLADTILPAVTPLIYTQTIGDKEVLIIRVFQGMQKPYFIAKEGLNQGIFVRVGAHTRRAEGALLEELLLKQQRLAYDEAPVTRCQLRELNLSLLPKGLRSEKMLFSLDILHRDQFSGEVAPTRGGVLMLHPHPENLFQKLKLSSAKCAAQRGEKQSRVISFRGQSPNKQRSASSSSHRGSE